MHVRVVSLAFAVLALGSAASAQETYELRRLVGRKPAVGERVRVEKEATQTQSMGPRSIQLKPAAVYVEEVVEVGADGEPTRVRRTYESFRDDQGDEVAVAAVAVVWTRDEATGQHAFTVPEEHQATFPPALFADMRKFVEGRNEREKRGVTEQAMNEAMFPAEPLPVGGTWTVDVAQAVRMIGLPEEDVDVAQSSGEGKVDGIEQVEGEERLRFTITLRLTMSKMRGRPLPAPAPLETTMTFRLPVKADGRQGDTHMTQHLEFAAPGPQGAVTVKIEGEKKERRTRIEPRR